MVDIKFANPDTLHHPLGPYCQVSRVKASEWVYTAGQTAVDRDGNVVGAGDLEAQCRQVFANIEAALRAVGADWQNVVHFTNYLVSPEHLPEFARFRQGVFPTMFPQGYPPNTLLYVDRLLRPEFLVEVQAIAAL